MSDTMGEKEQNSLVSSIELSQEDLKRILSYDPNTGIFKWRVSIGGSTSPNKVAGTEDTKGYIKICINGKRYGAHQLAWLYTYGHISMIDHKNDKPWDNRLDNLREATYSQNNHRKYTYNPHGHKGVRFRSGYYEAHIRINGVITRIGKYESAEAAGQAYKEKAKELFGEFAGG